MDFQYRKYFDLIDPRYITWEFYESFLDREPDFGQLGLPVYLRTYSRFIPQLKRREKFCEMILRVVEYSMSLDQVSPEGTKVVEARSLFQVLFEMDAHTAGRTMWRGNKNDEDATANFNCSFRTIDNFEAYVEIMYLLMAGAGTGFSVESKYISKLPDVYKVPVVYSDYAYISNDHLEHTMVSTCTGTMFGGDLTITEITAEKATHSLDTYFVVPVKPFEATITVGDSREGWCTALGAFLHCFTLLNCYRIKLVFDYVRPKGTRLKRMGGRASGPEPLKQLFRKVQWIISKAAEKTNVNGLAFLSSLDAMDIANVIGEVIVVGGVRRTAQIALGSEDDEDFVNAKMDLWGYNELVHGAIIPDLEQQLKDIGCDLWTMDNPLAKVLWEQIDDADSKYRWRSSRVMSNNSIMVYEKMPPTELKHVFKSIMSNGEPGFINAEQALVRRDDFQGVNPCAEILLRNFGTCNLCEIPLTKFVEDGHFNWYKYEQASYYIVRHNSRITNVTLWHHDWDRVQKEDRLLGVSLTGIVEAMEMIGYELTDPAAKSMLGRMKVYNRNIADYYHDALGIPRSKLVTTVKPSGTISQLTTCSSGIHAPYAPYYFRRIRVAATDPIAHALKDLGVPVNPENNQGTVLENADTWVFTFPVKTAASVKSVDEDATLQLERYKVMMDRYVEHNCSITVTVDKGCLDDSCLIYRRDQVPEVIEWLDANWDTFVGVAFLPRFDPSHPDPGEYPYPQPPYETCSEADYYNLLGSMPRMTENQFIELIAKYEDAQDEEIALMDGECAGICPSR